MVIRELLDKLDREKECHKAAVKRIEVLREDILSCCRNQNKALGGRKGLRCHDPEEVREAA